MCYNRDISENMKNIWQEENMKNDEISRYPLKRKNNSSVSMKNMKGKEDRIYNTKEEITIYGFPENLKRGRHISYK